MLYDVVINAIGLRGMALCFVAIYILGIIAIGLFTGSWLFGFVYILFVPLFWIFANLMGLIKGDIHIDLLFRVCVYEVLTSLTYIALNAFGFIRPERRE